MQNQATYYTNVSTRNCLGRQAFEITLQLNSSTKSYHPFGMTMPGRSFTSESYRFGFNGMEKDGEAWSGDAGSHLDFGARIYDSRLGRWLSVDPLTAKFPHKSVYLFSGANPVLYKDPDGQTETITTIIIGKDGSKTTFVVENENHVNTSIRTLGAMWIGQVAVQDISQTITIDYSTNPDGIVTEGTKIYSEPYTIKVSKYLAMKEKVLETEGGGYVFTSAKFEGGGETRTVPLENLSGIYNIDPVFDLALLFKPSGKEDFLKRAARHFKALGNLDGEGLVHVATKIDKAVTALKKFEKYVKQGVDLYKKYEDPDTIKCEFKNLHQIDYNSFDTIDEGIVNPGNGKTTDDYDEATIHD